MFTIKTIIIKAIVSMALAGLIVWFGWVENWLTYTAYLFVISWALDGFFYVLVKDIRGEQPRV